MTNPTMRAIFKLGLAAAKRDGDAQRIAWYQECIRRMNAKKELAS